MTHKNQTIDSSEASSSSAADQQQQQPHNDDTDDESEEEEATTTENEEEEEENDEEDEEEDDEEDDDDSSEYEPQLKYQRLVGSLPTIFEQENNTATALCVSDKLIILGTNLGFLYLLNFEGYCGEKFRPHVGAVRDVSIDLHGDYVASCSDDGKIVVRNLCDVSAGQQPIGVGGGGGGGGVDLSISGTRESSTTGANNGDSLDILLKGGVSCVQVDPEYVRRNERVICGGRPGKLILMKKGWFGYKETIIHKNEGPIHAIRWFKNLIAWANDQGVKIYNVTDNEKVSYIPRQKGSENKGTCRCNLVWHETPRGEDRLIVGWGTSVAVLNIKDRVISPALPKDSRGPNKVVEIMAMFDTDFLICGIQPYGNNELLLLAYDPTADSDSDEDEDDDEEEGSNQKHQGTSAPRPELRILDMKGEELSCDALSIKNYENYSVHDYRLEYCEIDNAYYILSQRDIVVAKPRDADDHMQWLLAKDQFTLALDYANEQSKLGVVMKPDYSIENIGRRYISFLLGRGEWDKAAQLVPQVAGTNVEEWEKWIWSFIQKKKFDTIVPYIPIPGGRMMSDSLSPTAVTPTLTGFDFDPPTALTKEPSFRALDKKIDFSKVRLSDTIYEMLLNHYLFTSAPRLLQAVQSMPKELYNSQHIITAVTEQIKKEYTPKQDNSAPTEEEQVRRIALLNTLAQLYTSEQKYEKTLDIYLQLKQTPERVFQFIEQHELFSQIQDKIIVLLKLDEARALDLLMNNVEQIQVDKVVRQLKDDRQLLHMYLDALFKRHSSKSSKFHLLQVELYAEFDTEKLVWFLEQSQSYNIEKALAVCEGFLENCEDELEVLKADPQSAKSNVTVELELNRNRLYQSIVYLLGRMGNTKDALQLIINKLQDVNFAIGFVNKQRDAELWQDLIKYSLNNGTFIAGLLDHMADYSHDAMDHMDPMTLIQSIPDQMRIPDLKYKLANVISDYSLQLTLQKGCQQVLDTDTRSLSHMLHKQQRKAVKVSSMKRCVVCGNMLRSSSKEHTMIFMCGHAYHVPCFLSVQANEQRKEKGANGAAEEKLTMPKEEVDPVTGRSQPVSLEEYRHRLEDSQGESGVRCVLCHQKDREKDRKTAALRQKRKD